MRIIGFAVFFSAFAAIGCGASSATTAPPLYLADDHPHGHFHEHGHAHAHGLADARGQDHDTDHGNSRAKMLKAESGATSALLTAHLSSKEGNELDVYVERGGKPFALATQSIVALVKGKDQQARTVAFECAPLEERPITEPMDRCSHFVARAPWMQRDDVLEVHTELPVEAARTPFVWRDFGPSRYAHHDD